MFTAIRLTASRAKNMLKDNVNTRINKCFPASQTHTTHFVPEICIFFVFLSDVAVTHCSSVMLTAD